MKEKKEKKKRKEKKRKERKQRSMITIKTDSSQVFRPLTHQCNVIICGWFNYGSLAIVISRFPSLRAPKYHIVLIAHVFRYSETVD